ncbi:ABC transporter ATP-binding protein [Sinimarinibacterium sp. CAU 1509]|uniref:ABC transporter ATP-binding protein n=1 Tax=Sinimarinibacterium sp. CAU 1509 TaxID=2562283 RepID=UPI0010AD0516|nr:ABC transporter ATP-binding protein [Sinimarinibacterium sp. CAU 1509]TJY62324.1 ABC transporter ATP-binding protein [Sinimarinibacterium sp. CAU 1509]
MIRLEHLNKRYPGAAQAALDDVSLHVPRGGLFGLLGPNGAGKTTLMSILTGTLTADSGSVTIGGHALAQEPATVRALLGYAPQELAFYPGLTVAENLELFACLTPRATAHSLARAQEVADLKAHRGKRAETLSGGLKRRLNFAIALLGEPQVLCLDEATAGVDPQSRNFLIEAVRNLAQDGVTVLYSTHYMEEIERLCASAAILDQGQLVAQGPLDALRIEGERLEAAFLRLTHTRLRDSI